jgi:hypothetical protein
MWQKHGFFSSKHLIGGSFGNPHVPSPPKKIVGKSISTGTEYVTPDTQSTIYCEKVKMCRKLVFLHQIRAACLGW